MFIGPRQIKHLLKFNVVHVKLESVEVIVLLVFSSCEIYRMLGFEIGV